MFNEITLSWWNTGLVPPVSKKIKEPVDILKVEKIKNVIFHIMEKLPIDILILGEVSQPCSHHLELIAKDVHMDLVLSTEKINNINFDIALFYEIDKLEFIEKENLVPKTSFGKHIRCGTRFLFREKTTHEDLTIFVSHWPSRLHNPYNRTVFGQKLREHINFIFNKNIDNIILVGDYNDQPYSESITEGIEASKDIDIVRKKRELLYNPFWRHLDKRDEEHIFSGSYYHKGNLFDKWFTYDQMMFSSSFLIKRKSGWKLDINSSCFHDDTIDETEIGFDFLKYFDHVPIYNRILKNE